MTTAEALAQQLSITARTVRRHAASLSIPTRAGGYVFSDEEAERITQSVEAAHRRTHPTSEEAHPVTVWRRGKKEANK